MTRTVYPSDRYNELVRRTVARVFELSDLKGGEYSGDDDRLRNFRNGGDDFGVTPELVWGVYAKKHWDAITTYVNDVQHGKTRKRLESVSGRCDDLIVYLMLLKAMVEEREFPIA